MSPHKFVVGQLVDLLPGLGDRTIPRGKYRVQRCLPSETRDPPYRVKHAVDGHERVVLESQLIPGAGVFDTPPPQATGPAPGAGPRSPTRLRAPRSR